MQPLALLLLALGRADTSAAAFKDRGSITAGPSSELFSSGPLAHRCS
jgi:hypothetical protein